MHLYLKINFCTPSCHIQEWLVIKPCLSLFSMCIVTGYHIQLCNEIKRKYDVTEIQPVSICPFELPSDKNWAKTQWMSCSLSTKWMSFLNLASLRTLIDSLFNLIYKFCSFEFLFLWGYLPHWGNNWRLVSSHGWSCTPMHKIIYWRQNFSVCDWINPDLPHICVVPVL